MEEIKKDGVGTYYVEVAKADTKVWKYLDKEEKNYVIWKEVSERYPDVEEIYKIGIEKE